MRGHAVAHGAEAGEEDGRVRCGGIGGGEVGIGSGDMGRGEVKCGHGGFGIGNQGRHV